MTTSQWLIFSLLLVAGIVGWGQNLQAIQDKRALRAELQQIRNEEAQTGFLTQTNKYNAGERS